MGKQIFTRSVNANFRAIDDKNRTIEGYAIVFNERSTLVVDWNIYKVVEEVIAPSAVSEEMLRSQDIVLCLEHRRKDRMIARCDKGVGSLKLGIDSKGVWFRTNCPNTPDGQTAYEGIKRNDYKGCSFCYWNDDDCVNVSYTKENEGTDDEMVVRTVNTIDHIEDFSIVLNPAYESTDVNTRSAESKVLIEGMKEKLKIEEPKNERSEDMIKQFDEMKRFARR